MAGLSINPLAKIVSKVNSNVSAAVESARTSAVNAASNIDKIALDQKIDQLSGGLTSGLNQAASGALSGKGSLGDFSDFSTDSLGTAMGSVISSPTGASAITSFADDAAASIGSASSITKFGGVNEAVNAVKTSSEISGALSKLTGGNLGAGLQGLAGQIGKAAGSINDILSLKRGANLPDGGELFTTTGEKMDLDTGSPEDWRVRIACNWAMFNSPMFAKLKDTNGVVFPYLPSINVRSSAQYTSLEPVHNNYPFQAYKNSQIEMITINGDFTCETEVDAAYYLAAVVFFRTVTKMFYGTGPNAGHPPPVCTLNGYGSMMFNKLPVVVKSFSIDLPNDVNYIKVSTAMSAGDKPTWVPIKSALTVEVAPIYNRNNLRQFSLKNFAAGNMTSQSGVGYF